MIFGPLLAAACTVAAEAADSDAPRGLPARFCRAEMTCREMPSNLPFRATLEHLSEFAMRVFLLPIHVLAVSLWLAPPGSIRPAAAADARPNILFCLADDWGWPHAGAYGDAVVTTPTFDRIAREGTLFTHAFCATPSCTASRAAILTGQYPHRLEEGANLFGFLPQKFPVYPNLLEAAGYHVGMTRKGWSPGIYQAGGYTRNPAGPYYEDFDAFLKSVPADKPFCFWFGAVDPHRPYKQGAWKDAGLNPENVVVPPYLPDSPEVRQDILDYYFEVQRFDRETGDMLALLEKAGHGDNTMVVITGDNGWPFPRAKANLYDAGSRVPLAVRWPARVKGGRTIGDFVNLSDLAPTFLEAAGAELPAEMTARSLVGLLTGAEPPSQRNMVFLDRERHANVRPADGGYPSRAVRTGEFLYIRNFRPDRWPVGDAQGTGGYGPFGDCDGGPTKKFLLAHRDAPAGARFFQLAFAKRPGEELYDVRQDPWQLHNLAGRTEYVAAQQQLRALLDGWMLRTSDPRAIHDDDRFDRYPYFRRDSDADKYWPRWGAL
jgi:arylsulfatase A-like enzyme